MSTQIKLASLADLKRAIKVPGIQIRVLSHWQPQLVGTTRTPDKAQTNGYFFYGPRLSDGQVTRMWADLPKASELRFNDDGSVTFYANTPKSWTLVFEAVS